MLSQPDKLRIRAGTDKNLSIPGGDRTSALAFERQSHHCRSAAPSTRVDDAVNEVDKLVWKANGDLLAHTITVAYW